MMLTGWGRVPRLDCRLLEPFSPVDVVAAVRDHPRLIARGAGRAYGDAALNADATVSLRKLDRIRAFDDTLGVLDCEAGLLLSDLIDVVLPRGWFPMVTPGTRFVTVGGAIAADVHGKNHHVDGSFGDHVLSFELVGADGNLVRCSPEENVDLFRQTPGSMGLTGVIVSARIRLRPVETAWIATTTERCATLSRLMVALDAAAGRTYSVAWIDTQARGPSMGRGIVFSGDHAPVTALAGRAKGKPLQPRPRRRLMVPFDAPFALARGAIMRAFNAIYYSRPRPVEALVDIDRFFYPLDAIAGWNRLYGPRGFLQFQCVLPSSDGVDGIARILEHVSASGRGSTLAVLKRLGPGRGGLSFPIEGLTLALDMSADEGAVRLYRELCDITALHGGRVYLAKDAHATPAHLEAFYPDARAFRRARSRNGSAGRFGSALSERLAL